MPVNMFFGLLKKESVVKTHIGLGKKTDSEFLSPVQMILQPKKKSLFFLPSALHT